MPYSTSSTRREFLKRAAAASTAVAAPMFIPARVLGLSGFGVLAEGAHADLVVLDRGFRVVRTFVGGREVYSRDGATVR